MRESTTRPHSYANADRTDRKSGSGYNSYPWSSKSGELSDSAYNGLIGVILLYGFGINAFLVAKCSQYFADINPYVLIIGYVVLCIAGIAISRRSDSAAVSFIGYNMVVIPIGIVLSICLAGQDSVSILNTCVTTAIVVGVMLIASMFAPDFFLSIGRALGFALLVVIVVEVVMLLIGKTMPTLWDVLVALIFCGYIGYDWAKAQENEHTADGAVDACVSLYLDIINLFLRILSLFSRKDDD